MKILKLHVLKITERNSFEQAIHFISPLIRAKLNNIKCVLRARVLRLWQGTLSFAHHRFFSQTRPPPNTIHQLRVMLFAMVYASLSYSIIYTSKVNK